MTKKLLNLFWGLLIFLFAKQVSAQITGPVTGGPYTLPNPLGQTDVIKVINNVLNYLIYISIPILAIMILWGGFQILTAREDPKGVTNGKHTILYSAIGFTVILVSKGIALILLTILGG